MSDYDSYRQRARRIELLEELRTVAHELYGCKTKLEVNSKLEQMKVLLDRIDKLPPPDRTFSN